MSISFQCSQCGKDYVVSDGLAGKSAICKACGARMTVPGDATAGGKEPATADSTESAPPLAAPAPTAKAPEHRSFALTKPSGSGPGGVGRLVWVVVVIGAAVFGAMSRMNLSSKSDVRAFFQGLVEADQQILDALKGVKDVESAKAASAPLNDIYRRKIDLVEKNRHKKGRTKDIEAATAEYKTQLESIQGQTGHEAIRVMLIPGAWDALDIKAAIERLETISEEVSKEPTK